MTTQRLNEIIRKHGIHPKFQSEFRALVKDGRRPSKELLTRLDCVVNYKAALREVMADLSKDVPHKLPHKLPTVTRYESLDLEIVER
jgi:hypothetical protein